MIRKYRLNHKAVLKTMVMTVTLFSYFDISCLQSF